MAKFVQMMGKMDSTANTAKGQLRDYKNSIEQLSAAYNKLNNEQKNSTAGKAYLQAIEQLKVKAREAKQEIDNLDRSIGGSSSSSFGQFGSIIDDVGKKMGITGDITSMLTSKTALLTGAVGAGIAIIGKAAESWASYNSELGKQDNVTQVTTGLQGGDAERMTDVMRALSDTYKVDFREAVNAANVLMSQFGATGDEAIQLLRDGMQGMILGDGPKLLQMIQQYAPAFSDAGISASELVAIIHNSEGGIFTDQNMQAIVTGIKNIRLMTDSTKESIAQLGIDGEEMSRKMNDGSMTVFDALREVMSALEGVDSNSKTAGDVLQNVFGRQGVNAGTSIAQALNTLNLNLDQTKKQTGELGDSYAELERANERLNVAIRNCFGYDGWSQMANGIKAELVTALAAVIDKLGEIWRFYVSIWKKIDEFRRMPHDLLFGKAGSDASGGNGGGGSSGGGSGYSGGGGGGGGRGDNTTSEPVMPEPLNLNLGGGGGRRGSRGGGRVGGGKTGGVHKETDAERAQKEVANALAAYNQTITQRNLAMESGIMDTLSAEKAEMSAKKRLMDAYAKAYDTYADPKYKDAYAKTADEYVKLGIVIKATEDGQKAAAEASKEAAKAQEKLAKEAEKEAEQWASYRSMGSKGIGDYISMLRKQQSTTAIGSDEYNKLGANILDATTFQNIITEAANRGIDMMALGIDKKALWETIIGGEDIIDDAWRGVIDILNANISDTDLDTLELDVKTGSVSSKKREKGEDNLTKASKALSAIGSIKGGLESIGVKIPGSIDKLMNVMQGVISVVQGVQTVVSIFSTTTETANTVATGVNTAALTALTTAIWANTATSIIPGFANSGIVPHAANGMYVPGRHFSNDMTPVMANAGELILNRAAQGNIASQLTAPQYGGGGNPYVTGEMIFMGLTSYLRRTGRGEIMTSKR